MAKFDNTKRNNLNPLFISEDPKKNNIFWKGMYAINQLNSIMSLIMSGRMSPDRYKHRYAPRIYNYRQAIYDFFRLLEGSRDLNIIYIYNDAKQTLRDFDECLQEYIATENDKERFRRG